MKKIHLIFSQIFFLLILSSNPGFAQQPYQVEDIDMALIYYKLSGTQFPWKEIAQNYPEYRKASDEFARQDVLEKLKLRIEEQAKELMEGKKKSLAIITRMDIKEYDFDHAAFPLDFSENTYFSYASYPSVYEDIAVTFKNGSQFTMWPVSKEEARKITQQIGSGREVVATIEFIPVSAKSAKISYRDRMVIEVNIIKISFQSLDRKTKLGFIEAKK